MDDVLGYQGAAVVVTGAASGMGAATAQILVDLGAEVTAIDIKPTDVPVARFARGGPPRSSGDRGGRRRRSTGPVDGLFSCAGLPGPPFSELDTMKVNFVGARHLAEQLVPKMRAGSSISAISSSAAVGWWDQMETIGPLLATQGFDEAVALARGQRGEVVLERLPLLEVGRRCVGRVLVRRPGRAGHPDQLHQPRAHRHGDDAGVPGLRHQGGRRPGRRPDRSLRADRRSRPGRS